MTIIDKINRQADIITRFAKIKNTVDRLKINWETDVKKMDFDKLHSGNIVRGCKYLRMDKIKIEPNPDKDCLFESADDYKRMVNLIELINSDIKVIPPTFLLNYTVRDGVKLPIRGDGSIGEYPYQVDGSHRVRVAAYLQLPEIPIIVFERIDCYQFTPGMWKFEEKHIQEEVKSGGWRNGSYLEAKSDSGKIVKITGDSYPLHVNESRIEYIEINGCW